VAVVLTILAGDVGQITGSSHVLERVVQKGVFRLAVLCVIVDTTHGHVALLRTQLYVLNFKPVSLSEMLRLSTAWTHQGPQSHQQEERKTSQKAKCHLVCVGREKTVGITEVVTLNHDYLDVFVLPFRISYLLKQ
jgi:hypothetical protein